MRTDAKGMFLIPVIIISQQDFGSHRSYAKHGFSTPTREPTSPSSPTMQDELMNKSKHKGQNNDFTRLCASSLILAKLVVISSLIFHRFMVDVSN